MAERTCRVCGVSIVGKYPNAKFCSRRCQRRQFYLKHRNGSPPDDEDTEQGRLEVRRRLAAASYVERRCRCSNPLGLVDEDGEARCFRCGWPLALDQVGELPPAA